MPVQELKKGFKLCAEKPKFTGGIMLPVQSAEILSHVFKCNVGEIHHLHRINGVAEPLKSRPQGALWRVVLPNKFFYPIVSIVLGDFSNTVLL